MPHCRSIGVRLILVTVSAAVAFIAGSAHADEAGPPRNVVIIVADDLGFQLGCYGDKVIRTPNIDRLSQAGTRFTRGYCTTASCSASRSVLMTGLYNHATGHYGHAHGYNHFSTYDSVRTLPVLMAEAGYRTCSIGKYHLAPEAVYHFETYRNEGVQGNRNAVRMATNAKEWIAEDDARPFLLYFCPSDPHRGGGPDGFANHNDNPDFYPGVVPVKYRPQAVDVPAWLPDNDESRKELGEYYQAISRMDQGIGTLLDALEETGHWDDTLIIFLADNGPPFPGAKTTQYEPGMNLPLIVRDPGNDRQGQGQGQVSGALVCWVDIVPTVLDFCGVTPEPAPPVTARESGTPSPRGARARPVSFHGRSFLKAVRQPDAEGFDTIFGSHTFHEITNYYPMRSLVEGRYKYILNLAHELPYPFASDLWRCPTWQGVLRRKDEYYGQRTVYAYLHRPRHELYDLEEDPHEIHNLVFDPAHAERLEQMQAKLKAWQEETKDPWVLKWEYE